MLCCGCGYHSVWDEKCSVVEADRHNLHNQFVSVKDDITISYNYEYNGLTQCANGCIIMTILN